MNHLIRNNLKSGYNSVVGAGHPGMKLAQLAMVNLGAGESHEESLRDRELVGVILTGTCSVTTDRDGAAWNDIGGRTSVFEEKATAFYLPVGAKFRLEAKNDCSVALCTAPSQLESEPFLVRPQDVCVGHSGVGYYRRDVCDIIRSEHRCQHLLVGETYHPPGNWSSYPPHRHEQDNPPLESKQEEIYHFRISPASGFGVQWIYSDDRSVDAVYVLHDGDTMVIPSGYHPLAVAPGHRMYYLWVMAGNKRELIRREDPAYAWMKDADASQR